MPKPNNRAYHRFDAIGTAWEIETPTPLSDTAKRDIDTLVASFTREYSRFDSNSLVTTLARSGGSKVFTHGVDEIFSLYDSLYAITNGRVTPLIGNVLEGMGYDANYSFKQTDITKPSAYPDVVTHVGQQVTLSKPAILDIGAVGKGYLVDAIARIVAKETNDYIVDGSGDMLVGTSTTRVGLEHPSNSSLAIGHVDIKGASICGSASNRRAWGDGLHHIVDPVSLEPTQLVTATWAIAQTALLADGLATALFFTDPTVLSKKFAFSYIVLRADGSVMYSDDPRITLYD